MDPGQSSRMLNTTDKNSSPFVKYLLYRFTEHNEDSDILVFYPIVLRRI